jgi:hypothetical protein
MVGEQMNKAVAHAAITLSDLHDMLEEAEREMVSPSSAKHWFYADFGRYSG